MILPVQASTLGVVSVAGFAIEVLLLGDKKRVRWCFIQGMITVSVRRFPTLY